MRLISAQAQTDGAGPLTMTQLRVLGLLQRAPRLPSELARELRITPATASEVADLLVRRGLVERSARPQDRRATPLHIMPAGMVRLQAARDRATRALADLLGAMDDEERRKLEHCLETLQDLLSGQPLASGTGRGDSLAP